MNQLPAHDEQFGLWSLGLSRSCVQSLPRLDWLLWANQEKEDIVEEAEFCSKILAELTGPPTVVIEGASWADSGTLFMSLERLGLKG